MDEPIKCKIRNFECQIDDSFFVELYKRRLRSYKTAEVALCITANITNGVLQLNEASFQNTFGCTGLLVCFNTFAEFSGSCDFEMVESQYSILTHPLEVDFDNNDLNYYTSKLSKFAIFTYVDLIKLVCHYRIIPLGNFNFMGYTSQKDGIDVITTAMEKFWGFEKIFLLKNKKIKSLNSLNILTNPSKLDATIQLLVISDTESVNSMSLHLANVLSYVCNRCDLTQLYVYFANSNGVEFVKLIVKYSERWEIVNSIICGTRVLNNNNGIDMSDLASNLHFELALWRIIPELDRDKMGNLSIAILGMGTLGCAIATQLLNWGIRHITLVDSGRVSYFNIGRQSLYTLDDAKNGKLKVYAASDNLRKICPNLNVKGYNLDIPMLGYSIYLSDFNKLERSVNLLCDIVCGNDVLFMVTDSRESRWLPTLLISHRNWGNSPVGVTNKGTLGIVASIGFDSCLVSRQSFRGFNGSCYFCGDFVAPTNTQITGLSDEICTVTRPGIAPICASLAVELVAALTQSHLSFSAMHGDSSAKSCLGSTPQTIRFNLSNYSASTYCNERNPKCICCSSAVVEAYDEGKLDFLKQVIAKPDLLVALTHLDKMDICDDVITL